MTTLYKPALIETAEQAEALPDGTVALLDNGFEVCVKDSADAWLGTHGPGAFTDQSAIGMTALVPIEAEEVHVTARGLLELDMHGRADVNHDVADARLYRRTEYRTPWEEA